MTLATTCPHCRTSFRVVADQLKLRRGRVRCGRCQKVFSGVDYLIDLDEPDLIDPEPPTPPTPPTPEPLDGAMPQSEMQLNAMPQAPELHGAPVDPTLGEAPHWPVATPMIERISVCETVADAQPQTQADRIASPAPEPILQEASQAGGGHEDQASHPQMLPLEASGLQTERPRSRSWLWMLIALGLVGLMLQGLLGWRHELAYRHPLLFPWIAQVAQRMGLSVHPPLDADALTIESFELRPTDLPDQLRLEAVLRNRSQRPVAFPAIELTLRDSQSVMLVRRVIPSETWTSQELRSRGIAPGTEWPVQLVLQHDGLAVAGYSAVLFHP